MTISAILDVENLDQGGSAIDDRERTSGGVSAFWLKLAEHMEMTRSQSLASARQTRALAMGFKTKAMCLSNIGIHFKVILAVISEIGDSDE